MACSAGVDIDHELGKSVVYTPPGMTLPNHTHWFHHIHQSFVRFRWSNRKRTSEILSGAEELREGWRRGIGNHSTCCRPFHSTLYCPVSTTCWAFQGISAYKSGNDGVKYIARGEIPDADWNDASSRRRVANPLKGNRRPDQITFKARKRPNEAKCQSKN